MTPSKTTLVLLPGLDGTEIFFGPLLTHLPKWVNPLVVTYPTTGGNNYPDLLEVVQAAINDSDSTEFYVLGWSFSGPLALMLAAKHPTRIRGVILCASFVRPPLAFLSWLRFGAISPVVHLVRLARRLPVFLFFERRIGSTVTKRQLGFGFRTASWRLARGPYWRLTQEIVYADVRSRCSTWPVRETGWCLEEMLMRC